jgi:ParB-like chromosome segregation protein Spo0J
MIPRDQLLPPPEPVRVTIPNDHLEELVASMKELGQLVPLIVTPDFNDKQRQRGVDVPTGVTTWLQEGGMFEIIDGHCRYLAAPGVPLEELECSVFLDVTEAKNAMMLHAGIVRQSFTAYEEGRQFIELANKHGWSLEDLCKTFHRSESYINDRVDIAEGRPDVCAAVQERKINLAQAKQINRAKNEDLKTYLLDQAMVHGATARTLEVMRHNWEKENIFGEGAPASHTPAYAAVVEPPAERKCLWCDGAEDPENLRQVDVHWYHIKPLLAVVDQVGEKNLLKGKVASG